MKLSLLLLVLGALGFCLSPNETVESGGSVQDEFAVSIRARPPLTGDTTVIPEVSQPERDGSVEMESRR